MKNVFSALIAALKSQFHPRMLALVLWPALSAIFLWGGLALFFWSDWVRMAAQWLQQTPAEQWLMHGFLAAASGYFISLVLLMLLLPLIYVTALVITAVFAMPAMVEHVASHHYPHLQRKHGGTFTGSVINSLKAVFIYLLLWLLTLPLWLFTLFAGILPIILAAYLNQRLFRYDALAEHASAVEYQQVLEQSSGQMYVLGALAGLLQYIPLLNIFSAIYIGLAYTHLCLANLDRIRSNAGNSLPAD